MDIKGKVALVTGGAAGIGLAVATALLKEGAKGVALVDIKDNGREVAAELSKTFAEDNNTRKVIFLKADVSDKPSLDDAFNATVCKFKQLDIVINNADIANEYNIKQLYQVNMLGIANGADLAMEQYLPKYKSTSEAVIVNTSFITPVLALQKIPIAIPHYTVAKFGIIGLTLALGSEFHLKRTGVRIMCICPGFTRTALVEDMSTVVHKDLFMEVLSLCEFQEADVCAQAFILAIKEGKTGSIHSVVGGRVEEVVYPNFARY